MIIEMATSIAQLAGEDEKTLVKPLGQGLQKNLKKTTPNKNKNSNTKRQLVQKLVAKCHGHGSQKVETKLGPKSVPTFLILFIFPHLEKKVVPQSGPNLWAHFL